MAKIRMRDTTAHSDTGSLRAGEVYEVNDQLAQHLIDQGIARKASAEAQTYHDRLRIEREEAALDSGEDLDNPPMNPSIARQVAAAGTREGDRGSNIVNPKPVNDPDEHESARSRRR